MSSDVRLLPRSYALDLESMLVESKVSQVVLCSDARPEYREMTARQLRRIYRDRLNRRTPSAQLADAPFHAPDDPKRGKR